MIGVDFVAVLAAANTGDTHSFELLWTDLNPALARYLRVMVGDDAESVLVQTWNDITRGMPGFRGDESAWRAWAFGIARRRAITAGRRWFALPHAPAIAPTPPTWAVGPETTLRDVVTTVALELVAALPRLPAEVLLLRTVGRLSVDETARLLQRSRRAVRAAGYRGAANVAAAGLWLDRRAAEVGSATAAGSEDASDAPTPGEQRDGERWFEALLAGGPLAPDASEAMLRLADVLTALTAPASVTELRGSAPAFLAFERHVATPLRNGAEGERHRRGVLAMRAATVGVGIAAFGLGATAVAAFAGVLPAPLQDVAHRLIHAPSASNSHSAPPEATSSAPPGTTSAVPGSPPTGAATHPASRKPPASGAPSRTAPGLGGSIGASTSPSVPSPTPSATPTGGPSAIPTPVPTPTPTPTPRHPTPTKTHPHGPPSTRPNDHPPSTPPGRR